MSRGIQPATRRVCSRRSGFTLIELTGVLVILVLVAAMIIPLVGGTDGVLSIDIGGGKQSAEAIVTENSMLQLRDVIMGSGNSGGVWADVGHIPNRLPRRISDLFRIRNNPPEATTPQFDPVTAIGWRGPYLELATGNWMGKIDASRGFFQHYATHVTTSLTDAEETAIPAIIDSWGNPIVLQIDFDGDELISPDEARAARLVSAGANGTIDWELNGMLTQADYLAASQSHSTDDVVIYLGIVP
jgi:hypothetical protein